MSIENIITLVVWFVIGMLIGHIVSMLMNHKKRTNFDKEYEKAKEEMKKRNALH